MKIGTRLWIITILPFIFFLCGGLIGAYTNHLIDMENEKNHIADEIKGSLDDITILTHEYFFNPMERSRTQWQKKHASIQDLLLLASNRFEDASDKASLKHMIQSHETINALFSQFVITGGNKGGAELELRVRLFNRILQEIGIMAAEHRRMHEKSHQRTVAMIKKQNSIMIFFFAALSIVIFVIARLLHKGIVKPIEILHKGVDIVGSGNLDYKIGIETKDEIGLFSKAFDTMTENLKNVMASRDELNREIVERKLAEEALKRSNRELEKRINEIKTLRGLLPICSYCKKIRDDKGYWQQMEMYIRDHSDAEFSHGMCPECAEKAYKELDEFEKREKG